MTWHNEKERHKLSAYGVKTKKYKTSHRPKYADPTDYFKRTKNSFIVPIHALVKEHEPSEAKKNKARKFMRQNRDGVGTKRDPITVRKITDNKYLVLDGNTTTTVAPEFGLIELIAVEVE